VLDQLPFLREQFGHHHVAGGLDVFETVFVSAYFAGDLVNFFKAQVQVRFFRFGAETHPGCQSVRSNFILLDFLFEKFEGFCQFIIELLLSY